MALKLKQARELAEAEAALAAKLKAEGRRVAGAQLLIDVVAADAAVPRLREDESYRLFVTADKAMLSAHTASGAARGLETFLQLLQARRSVGS
jgi:hypothetical protein